MKHFRIFLQFGMIADVVAHDYIRDGQQFKFLNKKNEKDSLVVAEFLCSKVMGMVLVEDYENQRT